MGTEVTTTTSLIFSVTLACACVFVFHICDALATVLATLPARTRDPSASVTQVLTLAKRYANNALVVMPSNKVHCLTLTASADSESYSQIKNYVKRLKLSARNYELLCNIRLDSSG